MKRFGLVGHPLTHSFSPSYFEEKFRRERTSDCRYDLFDLESVQEFPLILRSSHDLVGLNITIPFKESVIQFLDKLDETAAEIGAVNCIALKAGKSTGYNTDAFGFEYSFKNFLTESPEQIFVLGTGGSAKAVNFVLQKMNLPFCLVSRKREENYISYDEISSKLKASNLFINTTPLGMFPMMDELPQIPFEKLTEQDFLFDLVYNPEETLFLKKGKAKGAKTKNGLEMLHLQAEKSWEIWNS